MRRASDTVTLLNMHRGNPDDCMTVRVGCRMCGETKDLEVVPQDWVDWQDGKLVQDALPYIDYRDRELLISGTCRKCWSDMFEWKEEDEDDA